MTHTEPNRTEFNRTASTPNARNTDRRSPKMVMSTETRRSFMTSEFWLTLIAAGAVVIAGYWTDANLRVNLAWALGIGVVAMYVLSRGIAKAGSSDPEIRDLDDFR